MGRLSDRRAENRRGLATLAPAGVLSRRELGGLGWDRNAIAREVRAGRWLLHGAQTVGIHTGPLSLEGRRWMAVWEIGGGIAAIDGVSALQAAGLTGFDDDVVHISVRHTANLTLVPGVRVHKVARRSPADLMAGGLPRTLPAVAAIRAAHWAVSDRQAALLLAMPVQQRLVSPAQLQDARRRTRGRTRRAFIRQVVADVCDGAHSLGELDFAVWCRRRGLPAPTRQAVRRGRLGRVYLDVAWEDIGLVVEIDGSGHRAGLAVAKDNLRQNELALGGETVLRIDLLGLRVEGETFMDQVCAAHAVLSRRGPRRFEVLPLAIPSAYTSTRASG